MRFYHRQLSSLKELHRERERLQASIGKLPEDKLANTEGATNQQGKGIDIADVLIDILSSEVVMDTLVKLGMPVVKKTGKFAGKSIFTLGKEVLGGYAKWKALEITYRWIRRYWLNKRHKEE